MLVQLLMHDELRDLIKSTLVHLETVGYPLSNPSTPFSSQQPSQPSLSQSAPSTQNQPWQRALRYCPPHLLDLLNSKACRGAIMFNDPLTVEQCERLVGQLSRTDAPFVCAHGRPSLSVLMGVGTGEPKGKPCVDWGRFMESGDG